MTRSTSSRPAASPVRELAAVRARLVRWHRRHGPRRGWEDEHDPYRILVREVMSQQTQIDRVVPHLARFIARFATIEELAAASRAEVIRAWSGLGYNRRAVHLHAAAREIVSRHGGRVPDDLDTLRSLPGVGAYTAAAVAVYAFGHRTPVVDTNIDRVLRRAALGAQASEHDVSEAMRALVHRTRDPRAVTQAIMDLGATLCRARDPRCEVCPLRRSCASTPGIRREPARSARHERFEGSTRQVRGRLVEALRREPTPIPVRALLDAVPGANRATLAGLVRDGLVEIEAARIRLAR